MVRKKKDFFSKGVVSFKGCFMNEWRYGMCMMQG